MSVAVSFGASALGYASEEWINGRTPTLEKTLIQGGFVGLVVFSLFFVSSLIVISIFEFHCVTIFADRVEYSRIFKKETIFFKEIKSVTMTKKAVISSVLFRVPMFEDYWVISGHRKIEIPAKLFDYSEQDNIITYRNQIS